MIRDIIDLLGNWRFWSFMAFALLPLWAGLVAIAVVSIQEKIASYLYNRRK